MESILQTSRDKCLICGRQGEIDEHHCLSGVSNRKKSENYGLKIYLCRKCHSDLHDRGKVFVDNWHYITENDIKSMAQRKWEETYGKENPRAEFIDIFGKSWILED